MDLREQLCEFGRSLYNRGLTHGSTGNLSARLPDGNLLVTPTGSSLGRITPESLSVVTPRGELVS
ncbi:MAG: class II aldolase/adducin family protein, partial [Gammaproteobacteria bacterium]